MLIVLDQESPKHVEVMELLNNTDITKELKYSIVEKKSIRVDDLICSFLSMMDAKDVAPLIFKDNSITQEYFSHVIEEASEEELIFPFKLLTEKIHNFRHSTIVSLLSILSKRIITEDFHDATFNKILISLIYRIQDTQIEKKELLRELYNTMVQKISEFDAPGERLTADTLKLFLDEINQLKNQNEIKNMFIELARIAEPDWVRQVLEPYIEKQKVVRSPVLPKNCVLYLEELNGTKIVVIEVPKERHHVTYHNTNFKQVGFPKLLCAFYVQGEDILRMEIMAVKDKIIKPTTMLYRYPFSNVHENFTPCWSERPTQVKNLSELTTIPYQFICAPNNDHLYRGVNLRERFTDLQNKDFDDKELVSVNRTLKSHFDL